MKTWEVKYVRATWESMTVVLEAETQEEAEQAALSGDGEQVDSEGMQGVVFGEDTAPYVVECVIVPTWMDAEEL